MIVPVAFTVQRDDQPESFLVDSDQLTRSAPAEMRIRVVVLDTETRTTRGISARVMFDPNAELGHEYATVFSGGVVGMPWCSEDYLRALRDGIDELLGDDDAKMERVEPQPHHRGPRVRVRGRVANEDADERGEYVEIEVGQP